MYNYYWYMDSYYMIGTIFVLFASLFALYAQTKVKTSYAKYKRIDNYRRISGAQVAKEILESHGLYNVQIQVVQGELSDHFNPSNNTVNLSHDIYYGTSIASIAVAAHECGHVLQHQEGYKMIRLRNSIIPFANIGQSLGWFAILFGLAIGSTNIAWIGFLLMSGLFLFQLFTLPVEFNASSRALEILERQYLYKDEYGDAKKMLQAAAMTYVAAMISTLMSMLRIFLMIFGRSRNEDD